jgi:hypothetical protein
MTNGYSLDEKIAFGFFDWTLVSTRPATEEEAPYGCDFYEDCPCCNCGEDVVVVEDYAGVRWSNSQKRMVERTDRVWVCAEHTNKH